MIYTTEDTTILFTFLFAQTTLDLIDPDNPVQFDQVVTGTTGLTPLVDVYNPLGEQVVTASEATEIGDGLYDFTLDSSLVVNPGYYRAVATVPSGDVDSLSVSDWAYAAENPEAEPTPSPRYLWQPSPLGV